MTKYEGFSEWRPPIVFADPLTWISVSYGVRGDIPRDVAIRPDHRILSNLYFRLDSDPRRDKTPLPDLDQPVQRDL